MSTARRGVVIVGRASLTLAIGAVLFGLGIAYAVWAWFNDWVGLLLYSILPTVVGAAIIFTEVEVERRRGR
jgi:hypothetical protein